MVDLKAAKDAVRSYLNEKGYPSDADGRSRAYAGCFDYLLQQGHKDLTNRQYKDLFDDVLAEKPS